MATLCRLIPRPVRSGSFFFRPFCSKGPQITSATEEGASPQESAQPNDSDDVLVPGFGAVTPKYPRKYVQLPSNPCKTDYRRREMVAKYEAKRTMLQAIVHDINIPYDIRCHYQQKLTKLPRNTSRTRVRNRCIYSGRPRAVYRHFRMSRICFRKAASYGEVMGVRKSSW